MPSASLRSSLIAWLLGIAVGWVLARLGIGSVRSLLFGLEPTDPLALSVAAVVILTVTGVAAWLPARRATRIEPVAALQ